MKREMNTAPVMPPPGVVSWPKAWSPGWVVFGPESSLQQATTDWAVSVGVFGPEAAELPV
jgi:hypothetical protein